MRFKKALASLLAAVFALAAPGALPQNGGLAAVAEAAESEEKELKLNIINNITTGLDVDIDDIVTITSLEMRYNSANQVIGQITDPDTVYTGDGLWIQISFPDAGYRIKNITINNNAVNKYSEHQHYYTYYLSVKPDTNNKETFTVNISGELDRVYPITIDEDIAGGDVTVDKKWARPGEMVTVTASSGGVNPLIEIDVFTPTGSDCFEQTNINIATRYYFDDEDGYHTKDEGYVVFEMPESEVNISAIFIWYNDETYRIRIAETENGTVSVEPKKAAPGEMVTITTTPDEGYELDSIKVVAKRYDKPTKTFIETEVKVIDGKFIMPEGFPTTSFDIIQTVTITATFKKSETGSDTTDTPTPSDPDTPTPSDPDTPTPTVPDITEMQVQATDVDGETVDITVNEDGTVDVSALDNGEYILTFSADFYVPREYEITVSDGAVTEGLEGGVKLHRLGDINGDGFVNTQDVAKANAHVKGTSTLKGYELACINVNLDQSINVQDVALMNAHAKNTKMLW